VSTRWRILIEYDGGPYKGWQRQENGRSVQAELERAVLAFSGEAAAVHGAGRTDTGVHAMGQVAHFDLERDWPAKTVRDALNAHLWPEPIAVLHADLAPPDFHARFSAQGRAYVYRILNRRAHPALERGRVWQIKKPLDAEAMHRAAQALVGRHDFTTFRDAQCQAKDPVKTLDLAAVRREGEEVRLAFAARSFLHRQVRSMTGTLVEVGLGRWAVDDVGAALAAADRTRCGPVAPPEGLYLAEVGY